jgi:virginiamycin A acetyltransferase
MIIYRLKQLLKLIGFKKKVIYKNIIESQVAKPNLIHPEAKVQYSIITGGVKIGQKALIHKADIHGQVEIGNNTSINGPNTDIYSLVYPVTIGKFCSIARSTSIQEYNHNYQACTSYFIKYHVLGGKFGDDVVSKGPITIGNDVWIGAQSVILTGASIGHGAVIGANSVVSDAIPPYAIAAGSPAKVIKYRFNEEVILKLLSIQWWDWPYDKIIRNQNLFEGELTLAKLEAIVD